MYSQWLSLSVLFFMMQSLQLRNKAILFHIHEAESRHRRIISRATVTSTWIYNSWWISSGSDERVYYRAHTPTSTTGAHFLGARRLELLGQRMERTLSYVNKTALMHARVLAAMSHFLSGPLRMRPSGVRGKTYPESVLTGGLSRRCRDIVAVIIESYPRRARVDVRQKLPRHCPGNTPCGAS